ncbi:MAG: SGNH/GDSL hydrolase family protein, partial [Clostridia bacterium]|nr:SGNH/GDSL hydrolase family protein [Clostridia bacterium]
MKHTLLILGDSIATGHSLPDYDSSGNPKSEYSWATLLSKSYGADRVNLAVDGDTTSDLLSVVQNIANRKAISEAKVICVSIGGNNFLQLMGRLVDDDKIFLEGEIESAYLSMQVASESELDGIFTALREINPHAEVLVQTMFEPYRYFTVPISQEKTIGDWMGSYVARYNTLLCEKAEQYGHRVVDVAETFCVEGKQSWLYASMSEGTSQEAIVAIAQANPHPTRAGHQGIFGAYCVLI